MMKSALADNDRNLHSVAILNSTRLEGLGVKLFVSTPWATIVRVAQLSRHAAMHTCSVLRVRFPHHDVFFVIFIYFFLIFSRLLGLGLGLFYTLYCLRKSTDSPTQSSKRVEFKMATGCNFLTNFLSLTTVFNRW